ncbi:MAG: efflux RND transporter permease subunit [Pseudomonadota bacterium]
MKFTDIFIQKPVLALVVSLMILVLGVRALAQLPVREYPESQIANITVTTTYFGANADVIAGFITAPLEAAIAQAQGIDYIFSTSNSGVSVINVSLRLNYDASRALSEISAQVNSVLNQLPEDAQQPSLKVSTGENTASMYLGFTSDVLEANQITDYLLRVVQPKLQGISGVQKADIFGARQFALRVWLDPQRLAAHGLTADDVYGALGTNNYISALGSTKGQMVTVDLTASTDLHSLQEFRQLVVKSNEGGIVRLEDVAKVTLGAEQYDFNARSDGRRALFIGISVAPEANVLTVINNVREVFPSIVAQLPKGLTGEIDFDATEYIRSSISEVQTTLLEALAIVSVVIFMFLGSARSVLIPALAIPLSLIGGFIFMLALGYSINLLTLLALVLAIGLVVDDAIIVVENVDRHMKDGMTPMDAALLGARELALPIIAMTVVLIAVYVPIGFQGGLTGTLFSEFAFTLAGAVVISGIIALTLSPMMAAYFLKPGEHEGNRFMQAIDRNFDWTRAHYERLLGGALASWKIVVVFGFIILVLIGVLANFSRTELAPQEDQGFVLGFGYSSPNATVEQMSVYSKKMYEFVKATPEADQSFQLDGISSTNTTLTGIILKPWSERTRSAFDIQNDLQEKFNSIAGATIYASQPPPLPTSSGGANTSVVFVLGTTDSFVNLEGVANDMLTEAQKSGKFYYIDTDLKINKPQVKVNIDRDKAAALGLNMRDIGSSLGAMLGGGYVNYFSIAGRSYKVIPQAQQVSRLNPEQLSDYYIRTASGDVVPASTVATLKTEVIPTRVSRFQQLNSATFSGVPSGTLGDGLDYLKQLAEEKMPAGYTIDYGGESRQFVQESSAFVLTMGLALIIIFLTLAAQFGSFRDPLIVLMSVPMAIFGAMVFIFLEVQGATLNIYTKVGLVTLVGLIAKHGILIVQFANDEQKAGKNKLDAIMAAAGVRLRPILMTTAAMVLGVMPLVFAAGAGAVGRNHMGLVIATGVSIGTLFTLFVVPAMYLLLAKDQHGKKQDEPLAAAPLH